MIHNPQAQKTLSDQIDSVRASAIKLA